VIVAVVRRQDRAGGAHDLGDVVKPAKQPGPVEAIADTVTFVVSSGVGLAVSGETIPYVAGWGEDGAIEAATQFATTIDPIARRIEDA
jgi:hypothetical protein